MGAASGAERRSPDGELSLGPVVGGAPARAVPLDVSERPAPGGPRLDGPPKRWKVAVLTFVGLYPLLLVTLALLGPVVAPLPFPARTAAVAALLVPVMVYAVMPALTRLFRSWLVR